MFILFPLFVIFSIFDNPWKPHNKKNTYNSSTCTTTSSKSMRYPIKSHIHLRDSRILPTHSHFNITRLHRDLQGYCKWQCEIILHQYFPLILFYFVCVPSRRNFYSNCMQNRKIKNQITVYVTWGLFHWLQLTLLIIIIIFFRFFHSRLSSVVRNWHSWWGHTENHFNKRETSQFQQITRENTYICNYQNYCFSTRISTKGNPPC